MIDNSPFYTTTLTLLLIEAYFMYITTIKLYTHLPSVSYLQTIIDM